MTVSTSNNSVIYRGNAATTAFPVPFKVLDEDHLVIQRRVFATSAVEYTYVGTDYSFTEIGDDSGTLTLAGPALDDDYELVIERIVPYTQDLDIVNAGGFYPDTVEEQLDLIVMGVQQVADIAERGTVVPIGESGLTLSKASERAGKFYAFGPDGEFIAASGTGADGALRADLADITGPTLIGTSTGENLAVRLLAIEIAAGIASTRLGAIAREQMSRLPFKEIADQYVGDLIPTATYPMAAQRLHENWIFVRVRTANLAAAGVDSYYWDEYLMRDPDGVSGVDGGWQMVMHRTFVKGRYTSWIVSPDNPGSIPNADFAIRLGRMADPYVSGGDLGNWRYRGFGHGGMLNTQANNQVLLNGAGANLQTVGAWPVGTQLYGTSLVISCDYGLVLPPKTLAANPIATNGATGVVTVTYAAHGFSTGLRVRLSGAAATGGITALQLAGVFTVTVTGVNTFTITTTGTSTSAVSGGGSVVLIEPEVVNIDYDHGFSAAHGVQRYLKMEQDAAFASAIGVQDSYTVLYGMSPFETDFFKPIGLVAEEITRDSQIHNGGGAWVTGAGATEQAYSSLDRTLVHTVVNDYGQSIRASNGSLAAFAWNSGPRRFFNDLPDYAKMYEPFASSSELGPAQQLNAAIYYETLSSMRTKYLPGGPA